jgi:hypothetical protein
MPHSAQRVRIAGPHGLGRASERQIETAAQGAGGLWAAGLRQKSVFSLFLFTEHSFVVFIQFFEQILYSFRYSNYSNEKFV